MSLYSLEQTRLVSRLLSGTDGRSLYSLEQTRLVSRLLWNRREVSVLSETDMTGQSTLWNIFEVSVVS